MQTIIRNKSYEQKAIDRLKDRVRPSVQKMLPTASELLKAGDYQGLQATRKLAQKVSQLPAIERVGQAPRALIVGGFVRDALMGVQSRDVDIQVYGVMPDELVQEVNGLFPDQVKIVGKSYEILKVRLENEIELDISIGRKVDEGKSFNEGDPFLSPKEAGKIRDFSINNFAADPLTGEVYDFWDGSDDIEAGTLRITAPEYFTYNPLQVMRAVQFCARFYLWPDEKSLSLMKQMVADNELSKPHIKRITTEFSKLLIKSKQPSLGFELMRVLGIVDNLFPELNELIGLSSNTESLWSRAMERTDKAADTLSKSCRIITDSEQTKFLLSALLYDVSDESIKGFSKRLYYPQSFFTSVITSRSGLTTLHELDELLNSSPKNPPASITRGPRPPSQANKLSKNEKRLLSEFSKLLTQLSPTTWETAFEIWKLNQPVDPKLKKQFLSLLEKADEFVKKFKLSKETTPPKLSKDKASKTAVSQSGNKTSFRLGDNKKPGTKVIKQTKN